LTEKGFELALRLYAPEPVDSDVDLIEQIVCNLVGNAEKYAASGRYLEISSSQNRDGTVVVVRDRGPGVPAKERKNIFKPFYRISNKLTDGVTGAGIGLAVSRMLAEKLGGSLELEKTETGAAFRLELPAAVGGHE
jgi:signal transduction histidine kinase